MYTLYNVYILVFILASQSHPIRLNRVLAKYYVECIYREPMLDPVDFTKLALERLTESAKGFFHPGLYERMMRDIGVSIGRKLAGKLLQSPGQSRSLEHRNYVSYLSWIRSSIKWVDSIATNESTSTISINIPRCPFGNLPRENPVLCHIEAGMLGSVAGDHFGYSKVSICQGTSCPPTNCRLTIHLERTPDSYLVQGPSFPLKGEDPTHTFGPGTEEVALAQLSSRERQILNLIGEGLSDKEVAGILNLSVRTVGGHIARIRDKIGSRSRGALIRLALRLNTK
jgi:DNA-binding CsgD family transcriptional regulator/predicted hydrocarbon binding protein